jgi:phosphoribosylanthranilate isomerase
MTLVKICGISDPRHARAAAALGADFVGMVFAPSRRQVTIGDARRIVAGLRKESAGLPSGANAPEIEGALKDRRPLLVGVFADQDPDTINPIIDECGLDLIQLSGSEPWEMVALIKRPVFKCMKVREGEKANELRPHLHADAVVLLDPYVSGTYGGTGQTLDWNVAAEIAGERPTVLAGGLNPGNVARAVATVNPWAVDVSSGVESDGVKDVDKIRAFIQAAKSANDA